MVKLTLYYPACVEIDGDPESVDFGSVEDLTKDLAIKRRMFNDDGELIPTYAYKSMEPELTTRYDRHTDTLHEVYYKRVAHEATSGNHWYAAVLTAPTKEEISEALKMLGTTAKEW